MNGVNRGMGLVDVKAHPDKAAADFDAAIRLRDDFADGYVAAAAVKGWLSIFYGSDATALRELATAGLGEAGDADGSRLGSLNQAGPYLAAASAQANAALRLQPEWFYVREILLPQIVDARRKQVGPGGQQLPST